MSKIVYRINGGTSVVQASAMGTPEDLTYAAEWLAHHRLYKMSKGGAGVTAENARAVHAALVAAADSFETEVCDPLEGRVKGGRISNLGQGEVRNPYNFLKG